MERVLESGKRLNITATNATLSNGYMMGIFVSQTSGTIKVEDSKGVIANTFSPISGTFYPLPCQYFGTLTVTISGTVDATVFYN